MVAIIQEAIRTRSRHPLDRQKRLVMRDAVMTGVELRDGYDRQFEGAFRQGVGRAQLDQQPHQMVQRGGHMRENRGLVAERAVAPGKFAIDRAEFRGEFLRLDAAHARHRSTPLLPIARQGAAAPRRGSSPG